MRRNEGERGVKRRCLELVQADLPSFITESDGGWVQVMGASQINKFKNRPSELISELEDFF